ncbi:MAG: 4-hydroxythreonine-4-phosphate dehydrogenase PdxA, partial [Erysipelotrichales bacterium]
MNKQKIALTLGDPAGIGPEIVLKAALDNKVREKCLPIIVGDLEAANKIKDIADINIEFDVISDTKNLVESDKVFFIDLGIVDGYDYKIGEIDGRCGLASYKYIEKATQLAMDGSVDAIATSPINKESLKAGKVPYIGHTEMLASLSDSHDPLTMFEVDKLRVFFLSRHVSLREACDMVKKDRIIDYVIRCSAALKKMGVEGTMAIAGLNPHGGENGLFGWEEV